MHTYLHMYLSASPENGLGFVKTEGIGLPYPGQGMGFELLVYRGEYLLATRIANGR